MLVYVFSTAMDQPNHILIIDDVPENVQLLSSILQKRGYQVDSAASGQQGLEKACSLQLHLILLDVAMPEIDGFEVCSILKETPATREIPVIFLTAFYNKSRVAQGFDLGGMDYIARSFNTSELFARIRAHLELQYTKDLLQHRNQELQELNTTLQSLHADKNELLGIVAHGLGSPLTAEHSTGLVVCLSSKKSPTRYAPASGARFYTGRAQRLFWNFRKRILLLQLIVSTNFRELLRMNYRAHQIQSFQHW
jgi:DNA-binding response OmpR family regulator